MLGLVGPLLPAIAQPQDPYPRDERSERKLPDGRSLTEAMLKEDHKHNLADLQKMKELIAGVEKELEKYDRHVLSMDNLKKLEEVEKFSRRIRDRMRRY